MKKTIAIIIAGLVICFSGKAQHVADKNFASALNKIINDYPNNFKNLKGEKIYAGTWKSIESLPGYENASIDSNDISNTTGWKTIILKSSDSAGAIKKFQEMLEKIDPVKFDCCSLTKEESVSDLLIKTKDIVWSVSSVNPEKDNKFEGMNLRLTLRYPATESEEYELSVIIEENWLDKLNTGNTRDSVISIKENTNSVVVTEEKKVDKGKCVTGNCINGIGTYVYKEGTAIAMYKGSFKNGKFNGQGNLEVTGDYKYTGGFKDGMLDGKGTYTFPNGDVYTGEMQKGNREGTGTVVFKNGKRSTGIWKEGRLWTGTGLLIYKNNDSYYGGVKENNPDGQGIFNYSNGKSFTGTFSKGSAVSGKGYLFYSGDSASYDGNLVNEKFNGMGALTLVDGEKFTGSFTDGKLSGNSKWTNTDGDQYDGNFNNNAFDGYGIYKFKNGSIYKGNWKEGKQHGQGSFYDEKGNLDYNGEWYEGKMQHPMESVSLGKEAEKSFSRITFKGYAYATVQDQDGKTFVWKVGITSEFHLRNNWLLYGTTEQEVVIDGTTYRRKVSFTGEFGVVSQTVYCSEEKTISSDPLPDGYFFLSGEKWHGILGDDRDHPGYHIIEGKNEQGNRFQIHDY